MSPALYHLPLSYGPERLTRLMLPSGRQRSCRRGNRAARDTIRPRWYDPPPRPFSDSVSPLVPVEESTMIRFAIMSILIGGLVAAPAPAEDARPDACWPQFRGPNASGVAPEGMTLPER